MHLDRPAFRQDIEGLRGLAILLVVGFHAGVSWLAGGFVGVDVFFLISGFLITGMLAREVVDHGDVDLAGFYARRAWRLVPVFLVVLLATLAFALWLYAPIDVPRIASVSRAVALHAGNILFAQTAVDYHANALNPFLHTWSLAVEEQFYLVWPLLFVVLGRKDGAGDAVSKRLLVGVLITGAVSLAASLWLTRVSQPWAFFGMPSRIWEFAAGGAVALTVAKQARIPERVGARFQIAGLLAIAIALLLLHSATPYPGYMAMLPVGGTAALLIGGGRATSSVTTRILSSAPLQWLGRRSYAWYLWHWPLVGVGAVLDWKIGVLGKLAWSAFALVLAALTYRFVEEPLRRRASVTGSRTTGAPLSAGWMIAATLAALIMAHAALVVARARALAPAQRAFLAARRDGMHHDCWGSLLENASAPCIFGDVHANTRVVLLGDSHAEHWLPAVDRIGRARHWKVYAMVKPACPVPDMPELVNARLKRSYVECTEWRRSMLERIVAIHPDAVILSSYDHYMPADGSASAWKVTPELWRRGLRRAYAFLSSAGLNTVVIRGTPQPGFDVPACLSRRASGAPFQFHNCHYVLGESLSPVAIAAQDDAARGLARIAFVDMNDQFCARNGRCPPIQRDAIVFRDDDHLTAGFSRAVAPVLGERIERAVVALNRR